MIVPIALATAAVSAALGLLASRRERSQAGTTVVLCLVAYPSGAGLLIGLAAWLASVWNSMTAAWIAAVSMAVTLLPSGFCLVYCVIIGLFLKTKCFLFHRNRHAVNDSYGRDKGGRLIRVKVFHCGACNRRWEEGYHDRCNAKGEDEE